MGNNKKDCQIGIRLTKEERTTIETLSKNRSITIAEFVRQSIYNYILQITENVQYLTLDHDLIGELIVKIGRSLKNTQKAMKLLKREINVYELSKIQNRLEEAKV